MSPKIIGVSADATKEAQAMLNRDLAVPDHARKTIDKNGGEWARWTERINIDRAYVEDAKDKVTTVFYIGGKVLPPVGAAESTPNIGKMAHLRIRVNFDDLYSDDDVVRKQPLRNIAVLETFLKALKVELPPEGGIPVKVMQDLFPDKDSDTRSPLAGFRVVASLVYAPPSEGYDRPFLNVERFAPDPGA